MKELIDAIMAGARSPEGLGTDDLTAPRSSRYKYTKKLQDAGLIFKGKVNHQAFRYFDSKERADAWVFSQGKKPSSRVRPLRVRMRAGWGPNDPFFITSQTRVTIAPTPPAPTRTNTFSIW